MDQHKGVILYKKSLEIAAFLLFISVWNSLSFLLVASKLFTKRLYLW